MKYAGWSDARLMKEYLEMQKAGFNSMFGHNARREQDVITNELHSRGIREIPNIFGPILVRLNTR